MEEAIRGNCHCGNFRFEIPADSSSTPAKLGVTICHCSLCTKLGSLWLPVNPDDFAITRDKGTLTTYRGVRFCRDCGTTVTSEHVAGPLQGKFLVNARAVAGFNPFQLGTNVIHTTGSETDPKDIDHQQRQTQTPSSMPVTGAEQDPVKHRGSCHCGKVNVELLVELDELEIKEDNCSSCVRDAYIGTYPTKEQVRIHGREHTFEYRYGSKFNGIAHCRTCGVVVFTNVYGPPLSVFDRLPAERKERALAVYWKNMALQPVNVRVLDGVDLGALTIQKTDEGAEGYVLPP
ncbi:Mss4-like protein [Echria macrotheca]|uniref:Mss4-like protein n=1 Tax=Echria macrotheca TaxID=438768 RepID=A0AAJ0BJ27_9PEZI|nr:Mss4-like protein [Echria macrotheca]